MNETVLPRVVVVGGGFAGLWATRALASAPVQITLAARRTARLTRRAPYSMPLLPPTVSPSTTNNILALPSLLCHMLHCLSFSFPTIFFRENPKKGKIF